jgi:AcrR family transcriptional regulator
MRDREKTRALILDVAFREMYERGFQGVGVREIAAKAGLTIGAFFHHFPTKSSVGYAIVDEVLKDGILERWISPLAAHENPLQGILKTYRRVFDEWPHEYVARGCPLNNLSQEMSAIDPEFRQRTRAVIELWIEETEKHLIRAREGGYLRRSTNTRQLAEFIVTLQEATFAMGKTLNDRAIYRSLYGALSDHLKALATPRAGRSALGGTVGHGER